MACVREKSISNRIQEEFMSDFVDPAGAPPILPLQVAQGTPLAARNLRYDVTRRLSLPPNEPVVLLVGPPSVGKTGVLEALIEYTVGKLKTNIPRKHQLGWTALASIHDGQVADPDLREFSRSLLAKLENETRHAGSTSEYFALAATQNQRPFFTLLETPGEHHLQGTTGKLFPAYYLSDLVESAQKKIYLFVFAHDIFEGNPDRVDLIKAYDVAVSSFIKSRLNPKRDRFSLIYTSVDSDPYRDSGHSVRECAERAFSSGGIFPLTGQAFTQSRVQDKALHPFSSGEFRKSENSNGELRGRAPLEYPQKLMATLQLAVRGRPWWMLW
jgi:hypothetical protein